MNASLQTARQESVLRKMHLGTKSVFFRAVVDVGLFSMKLNFWIGFPVSWTDWLKWNEFFLVRVSFSRICFFVPLRLSQVNFALVNEKMWRLSHFFTTARVRPCALICRALYPWKTGLERCRLQTSSNTRRPASNKTKWSVPWVSSLLCSAQSFVY